MLDIFFVAVRRLSLEPQHQRISSEQYAVVKLIAEGKSNVEVAETLSIHRRSVEQRLLKAREMLQVQNTQQLIAKLSAQGQVQ